MKKLMMITTTILLFSLWSVGSMAVSPNKSVTLTPNRPPFSLTAGEGGQSFTIELDVDHQRLDQPADGISDILLTLEQPYSAGVIDQVVNPVQLEYARYTVPITKAELSETGQFSFTVKASAQENATTGSFSLPLKISYFDHALGRTVNDEEKLFFQINRSSQNTRVSIRKVEISKDNESEPLKAGEPFVAVVYIRNTGDTYIEDAKVSLRNLGPDTFTVTNLGDMKYIDIPDGENVSTLFQLISSPDLPDGRYVLTVRLDYRDHNDILRYEEAQTFVTIGDENSTPSSEFSTPIMLIDHYTFGGDHITGGETFPLNMTFRNTNLFSKVDNVRVSIQDQSGTILPKRSSNTFYISEILPGEQATYQMEMFTDLSATPKPYQLTVRYQYEGVVNGRRISYTENELISIPLVQPEVLSVDTVVLPRNSMVDTATPIGATFINKGKSPIHNLTVSVMGDFDGVGQPYYVGSFSPGRTDSYDATITPLYAGELEGELIFTYDDFEGVEKTFKQPFAFSVSEKTTATTSTTKPTFTPPTQPEEETTTNSYWWIALLGIIGGYTLFRHNKKNKSLSIEENHHGE